jgi:hypothetical protein
MHLHLVPVLKNNEGTNSFKRINSQKMTSVIKTTILSGFLLFVLNRALAQESNLVYLENGRLTYIPFAMTGQTNEVNIIPDFSYAGYMGGGVALPEVPVMITIEPIEGTDNQIIQKAIDDVSSMALDQNGFRGTVLLKAGYYSLESPLYIRTSGVVLRGEGQGKNGTVLHSNIRAEHSVIQVEGSYSATTVSSTIQQITTSYVPVGSYSFEVEDASLYSVGDLIFVTRTPNQKWITDLGMDQSTLCGSANDCVGWTTSSYTLSHERIIETISGNTITINIPIVDVIEDFYGGGNIAKYSETGRIENCGIENLRVESFYDGNEDEDHAWDAVLLEDVQNCWVKKVTGQYMAYATVNIQRANFNTIEDCANINPVSIITGGRRYSFAIQSGLGNFFQRCYTDQGRHDFVVQARVTGPNVFLDCYANRTNSDIGPHQRWSTGSLFDNIKGGQTRVWNRGDFGTGHGWSGAQTMFWNVMSTTADIRIDSPLGAMNWGIGCVGIQQNGSGYWDNWGTPVLPRSLYLQQLKERLGGSSLDNVATTEQKIGKIFDLLEAWAGIGSFEDGGAVGSAPSINITNPAFHTNLDEWSGTDVEVEVSDSDGNVEKVVLLIDGEPFAEDLETPFVFANVKSKIQSLTSGLHLVQLIATDNDGNTSFARRKITATPPKPIDLNLLEAIELCDAVASSDDGNVALSTIDGSLSDDSRWSSDENGATLTIEACESRFVGAIGILWYRSNERQAFFDLDVSLDNTSWTNIYSGNSSGNSATQESYSVSGDSIKYVRYTGYGNTSNAFNSIIEIDFYTKKKIIVDTTTTVILAVNPNINEELVTLYPNPSYGDITISSKLDQTVILTVFDVKGTKQLTIESDTGQFRICSRTLSKGIYIADIRNSKTQIRKKLIIL